MIIDIGPSVAYQYVNFIMRHLTGALLGLFFVAAVCQGPL